MANIDPQTLQLILVSAVAVALVLQTIFLLALLVIARKAARGLKEEVEEIRSSVMPVIYNSRDLLARITPQIEATVDDLAHMAQDMRHQTAEIQGSAKAVLERMRTQMGRVDSMISSVLDSVDRASAFVTESVSKPVRQISGILASAKAVVESLRNSDSPRNARTPGDDSFI